MSGTMVGSEVHPARAARNTVAQYPAILPGPPARISLLSNAASASVHVTGHSAKDAFDCPALILGIEWLFADAIRKSVCGIVAQHGIIKISPGYRELAGAKGTFHDGPFQDGCAADHGSVYAISGELCAAGNIKCAAMLRTRGCESDIAADGRTGVEASFSRQDDVVLMDRQMPGMKCAGGHNNKRYFFLRTPTYRRNPLLWFQERSRESHPDR